MDEKLKCSKCKEFKDKEHFNRNKNTKRGCSYYCKKCIKSWKKGYYVRNKDKIRKATNKYYFSNKEKMKAYNDEYYINNRERIISSNLDYKNNRNRTDEVYRFKNRLRNNLNRLLKTEGRHYKSQLSILGCTWEELKIHLEGKFTDGMDWDNYGGDGWSIDHVIPLSEAKTIDEVYELHVLSNIQPLWLKDNIKKGNKIEKL